MDKPSTSVRRCPGPGRRPWTLLLDAVAPQGSRRTSVVPPGSSSSALTKVPDELMLEILLLLEPRLLGSCARVSRSFAALVRHPRLWMHMSEAAWRFRLDDVGPCPQLRKMMFQPHGSWRALFLNTPRVRVHGVYVSENMRRHPQAHTFSKKLYASRNGSETEKAEMALQRTKAINRLTPHYRYLRFFADGRVLGLNSHDTPAEVLPGLVWRNQRERQPGTQHHSHKHQHQYGLFEQRPNCLLLRVDQKLSSHPDMKPSQKHFRFDFACDGSLVLRGYHSQLLAREEGGGVTLFPVDHQPYRLIKKDEVARKRWQKAE